MLTTGLGDIWKIMPKQEREQQCPPTHPISLTINNKNFMTNNVRHHSIENSPINSSTINFGDNSALSARIQQLPENQSELKDLLIELQTLINGSGLKEDDKQDALAETQIIAVAARQPGEASSGSVRKALRYIKGLTAEGGDGTENAERVGAVVAEIGGFFGL